MGLLEYWQKVVGHPYFSPTTPAKAAQPGQGGRNDFTDSPSVFDCSGFVSWAFYKASGGTIKLPAFTDSIATAPGVSALPSGAAPQPGDLVLYRFSDPGQPGVKFPHVAIYAGNGMVIQSGGSSSRVNTAPVGQLPGVTYYRVSGAPSYSDTGTTAPTPSSPTPVTLPGGSTGGTGTSGGTGGGSGSGSGTPTPGAPVAAGERWYLWTNGTEGIDWIRFKVKSPVDGGDWINVRVPTPLGLTHAIGWGIHDSIQSWLPRDPNVAPYGIGIPISFYMLGGLFVLLGALALGFQAVDAAAGSNVGKAAIRGAALAA